MKLQLEMRKYFLGYKQLFNKNMQEKEKIDWPKEKLLHYGAGKLTKSELLAVVLGSVKNNLDIIELSKNILRKYPKFSLAKMSAQDLEEMFEIESSEACRIIATFELGRRMTEEKEFIIAEDIAEGDVEEKKETDILDNFGSESFRDIT